MLLNQIPPGESWSPRGADTLVNTGKTTTSAQSVLPRTFKAQELRSTLEQDPSRFRLHLELILCQTLHTQILSGENWSSRSVDSPVSSGITTVSA